VSKPKVSKRLSLTYGLRYSLFYRLGSSTVNIYENNSPVTFNTDLHYEKAIPTGTKYNKNEVIQSYDNLEPRFSASYQLNDAQSIKASYNRMTQYLQLISNTSSYPLDVWLPSDNFINHKLQTKWP
jgi:hypothetical protein